MCKYSVHLLSHLFYSSNLPPEKSNNIVWTTEHDNTTLRYVANNILPRKVVFTTYAYQIDSLSIERNVGTVWRKYGQIW